MRSSTGLEVGEALDLRLEHRAHRGHHDPQRAVAGVGAGVHQPAQHRQPPADGVAARAEPLVRQRLPARVVGDRRRVDQVGRAPRRGPRPRGRWRSPRAPSGPPPPVPAPRTAAPRPGRSGRARCRPPVGCPGIRQGVGQDGLGEDCGGQAVETHEFGSSRGVGTTRVPPVGPTRGSGQGVGRGSSLRGAADRPRAADEEGLGSQNAPGERHLQIEPHQPGRAGQAALRRVGKEPRHVRAPRRSRSG